ncbi:hypothetical protein ACR78Z_19575, partial [Sphingobacterium thalpophilum]|uniref:hypothetical protein n=1 Tax=Sphingobacterium thalpophilum TaxID=259 RepID=UPI003DA293B7
AFFYTEALAGNSQGLLSFTAVLAARSWMTRREPLSLRYRKRFMGVYGPVILPYGHKSPASSRPYGIFLYSFRP